jgi:hypothetical protein
MTYKEFYKLYHSYLAELGIYVMERKEVSSKYFVAISLLQDLFSKSYGNMMLRKETGEWIKLGGTLRLKKLLAHTRYNEDDLIHFNAFALLDQVSIEKTTKIKI